MKDHKPLDLLGWLFAIGGGILIGVLDAYWPLILVFIGFLAWFGSYRVKHENRRAPFTGPAYQDLTTEDLEQLREEAVRKLLEAVSEKTGTPVDDLLARQWK